MCTIYTRVKNSKYEVSYFKDVLKRIANQVPGCKDKIGERFVPLDKKIKARKLNAIEIVFGTEGFKPLLKGICKHGDFFLVKVEDGTAYSQPAVNFIQKLLPAAGFTIVNEEEFLTATQPGYRQTLQEKRIKEFFNRSSS